MSPDRQPVMTAVGNRRGWSLMRTMRPGHPRPPPSPRGLFPGRSRSSMCH